MRFAHSICRTCLVIGVLAAVTTSAARADTVSFSGVGQSGYGSFSGSISVDSISSTVAQITVQLTNTTAPVSMGGKITGFAFNNPNSIAGGDITGVTGYSTTYPSFKAIGSDEYENSIVIDDGINAAPFGLFDLGTAIGGDWSGGGNPHSGISIGSTATFIFQVLGTNFENLTAESIFATSSEAKNKNTAVLPSFVVRFRGGDDPCDWSDKAIAIEDPKEDPEDPEEPEDPNPVPAPAGGVLAAMAAVFGLGWRFRRQG